MLNRIIGCVVVSLALCGFWVEAGGAKDKVDTKKEVVKDKKEEVKGTVGTIKSVNMKEASFTIVVDKKEVKFLVTDDTKFIGPKGGNRGAGKDGLKDDCMEKDYVVRVVAAKDAKTAAEVHLPNRKEKSAEKGKGGDKK